MNQTTELAERLTALVRTVPGVSIIYRSTPAITNVVAAVVDSIAPGQRPLALVLVDSTGDHLVVTATIGVVDAEAAPEVCGSVHDAIVDSLMESGFSQPRTVRVTVGSVDA